MVIILRGENSQKIIEEINFGSFVKDRKAVSKDLDIGPSKQQA